MPAVAESYPRALVTGASSGLGKAFTEALIRQGIAVWGTSRNPDQLASTALFTPLKLDLTKETDLRGWYEQWNRNSGGFDLVVNNAGFSSFGPFEKMTSSEVEGQLRVLLSGPVQLAGIALADMRERKAGCLVNVSSVAGLMPIPFMSVYNSAKAGLSAFSQSLMLESSREAPWIIDFRPGDYQTAFNQRMQTLMHSGSESEQVWQRLEELMAKAPVTQHAANDLISALGKFRHCTRYTGSFLQTSIASLASRLLPDALKRNLLRRYFNLT
jgi:uncharacterized protein